MLGRRSVPVNKVRQHSLRSSNEEKTRDTLDRYLHSSWAIDQTVSSILAMLSLIEKKDPSLSDPTHHCNLQLCRVPRFLLLLMQLERPYSLVIDHSGHWLQASACRSHDQHLHILSVLHCIFVRELFKHGSSQRIPDQCIMQ